MDKALLTLYHRHVAAAFDRQLRLQAFLDAEATDEPFKYESSTATLAFGNHLSLEALDLGSQVDSDGTWLWSWNHPDRTLITANQELGDAVYRLGEDRGIASFTAGGAVSSALALGSPLCPHAVDVFAAVISGQFGFDAYYTMPFDHARSAAVIRDARLRIEIPDPISRILMTFPKVIESFPIPDQRAAFVAYLKHYHLDTTETPWEVHAASDTQGSLTGEFDRLNRLTQLKGFT